MVGKGVQDSPPKSKRVEYGQAGMWVENGKKGVFMNFQMLLQKACSPIVCVRARPQLFIAYL